MKKYLISIKTNNLDDSIILHIDEKYINTQHTHVDCIDEYVLKNYNNVEGYSVTPI